MWILWVRIFHLLRGLRFGAKCLANNMILGTCHAHVFNHLLLQHPKTNKKNSRTTSACNTISKHLVTMWPLLFSKLKLEFQFGSMSCVLHPWRSTIFFPPHPYLEPKMLSAVWSLSTATGGTPKVPNFIAQKFTNLEFSNRKKGLLFLVHYPVGRLDGVCYYTKFNFTQCFSR